MRLLTTYSRYVFAIFRSEPLSTNVIRDLEITKSVTKEGMYRFKDQHGILDIFPLKMLRNFLKIVSSKFILSNIFYILRFITFLV